MKLTLKLLKEDTERVEKLLIEKAENSTRHRKQLQNNAEEIKKDLADIRTIINEILNKDIVRCEFCGKETTISIAEEGWIECIFWGTNKDKFVIRNYNDYGDTAKKYLLCDKCKKDKKEWEIYKILNEKRQKEEVRQV